VEDAERVAAVVRSGMISQGAEVAAFEREFAACVGARGAVALSSGSAALHLALLALGVGEGDEVVIPSFVCSALHHAVTHCGATAVLADADPVSLSLDPGDVKRRLGPRTRAVIVPHPFGLATPMAEFMALGVPIVEDCAQAIGALDDGRPVGSRGAIAVFSFYATKMLTTGEGGMVTASDPDLLERVRDLREYDEREELRPRFNAKLTDMQAALGRAQLARLGAFISRRRDLARLYRERLCSLSLELPPDDAGGRHVYHRFVIRVRRDVGSLIERLEAQGVQCRRPVFAPLHRQLRLSGFPVADRLWEESLSIPCYPSLTDSEAELVTGAVSGALEA
jgi:dTDP-4-amino-4,6-dideoxygalactose transaminase